MESPPAANPPNRAAALAQGKLILLAEDHPVNRDVIVRQLGLLGYAADVVENGAAALAALEETPYGLVLTDCNMPVMNGFELAHQIRAREQNGRRSPIIALTANALAGEAEKCLAAGMDDYLAKPVDLKTLGACLARWLAPGEAGMPAASAPREAGTHTAATVIDFNVLADNCGADAAFIGEALEHFAEALEADLSDLRHAIEHRRQSDAVLYAHRMNGAARTMGATRLLDRARTLEHCAEAGDWDTVDASLPLLVDAADEVEQLIAERRGVTWGTREFEAATTDAATR